MAEKISVFLAGPGHEVLNYQMLPPFLPDERLLVCSSATSWDGLQATLQTHKPEVLVVHAGLAPGAEPLMKLLGTMQAWNGTAIVVLPEGTAGFRGAFQNMTAVVSGVFVLPVSWSELVSRAHSAGVTARAKLAKVAAAPASVLAGGGGFASQGLTPIVTGTKRIAVLSHAGGAGVSTIAENLAYELAVRLSIRTLLFSLGLPPAVVSHLRMRYAPSLTEFFERPGKAVIQAATQKLEGLDILIAPGNSIEYLRGQATEDMQAPNSIYSALLSAEDGTYAAMVMDLPGAETTWMLHPLYFANIALVVARPTTADLFATRHTLTTLNALGNRIGRESIHLVLNQASDASAMTPRTFLEELASDLGWAPPIAAVIEQDAEVQRAQDQRLPAVTRSEKLAKGVRQIIAALFPGMERSLANLPENSSSKSFLRLPKFSLG